MLSRVLINFLSTVVKKFELIEGFTLVGVTSGGGGGTEQSFIQGGSAPRSSPLPFYIPFLPENVLLAYIFHPNIHV